MCINLDSFSKNTQTSNYLKFRPVGDELLHADRRGEIHSRSPQFCGRLQKSTSPQNCRRDVCDMKKTPFWALTDIRRHCT